MAGVGSRGKREALSDGPKACQKVRLVPCQALVRARPLSTVRSLAPHREMVSTMPAAHAFLLASRLDRGTPVGRYTHAAARERCTFSERWCKRRQKFELVRWHRRRWVAPAAASDAALGGDGVGAGRAVEERPRPAILREHDRAACRQRVDREIEWVRESSMIASSGSSAW